MVFKYIAHVTLFVATFGMNSAMAMSSVQPTSSSALSSASASSALATPNKQMSVIAPLVTKRLASDTTIRSHAPQTSWTIDDLTAWLNREAQLGHDVTAVSSEFFSHLQKFVDTTQKQNESINGKDAKAPQHTSIVASDSPTPEDDAEVKEIMGRKPITKVRTLEQMLAIQQRALQDTHDCTTWLAWQPRAVLNTSSGAHQPKKLRTGHFKSITFRRL